jgi:NAD(P)-dependent dehydrogenase (short-subunit alcohol dehydrogenase family)
MDKVVLITGVSEGIGRATALESVRRGARVVLGGRSDEAGQASFGNGAVLPVNGGISAA